MAVRALLHAAPRIVTPPWYPFQTRITHSLPMPAHLANPGYLHPSLRGPGHPGSSPPAELLARKADRASWEAAARFPVLALTA